MQRSIKIQDYNKKAICYWETYGPGGYYTSSYGKPRLWFHSILDQVFFLFLNGKCITSLNVSSRDKRAFYYHTGRKEYIIVEFCK